MKILLDSVFTHKPSVCSTSYLMQEIIERLSAARDDAFFYLLYPAKFAEDEVELAFLRQHADRVTLIPVSEKEKDRVWEMFEFSNEIKRLVVPGDSPIWDVDVIVTSRIPQIANYRASTARYQSFGKGTYRQIVGLDEMPIFSFRQTVAWAEDQMDLTMLAAYWQADSIIANNLWTKKNVLQLAREWLSPSRVQALGKTVHEAIPVKLERLSLVKPVKKSSIFNVVFTGRVTGTRNFADVAEVFRKHFSYAIGKQHVKFVVSTHSDGFGSADVGEIDFIDVQHNTREQFYEFLDHHADVAVNLSTVEDFSLSTYEPLLHGVPVVVADRPWSEFLGKDYPFRAKSIIEAYGLVKMFIEDPDGMYEKFLQWEMTTWKKLVDGPFNTTTSDVLLRVVNEHEEKVFAKIEKSEIGATYREIVEKISATDLKTVNPLEYAQDRDWLIKPKNWEATPIAKRPELSVLRAIMHMAGWKDTNEVGVMVR
jgi:glycosyltransferase involved in cell wall biosynthesis